MEAKTLYLSKCLNCSNSQIEGQRKSHKAVFHCSCGSKYKILFVKNNIVSVCGLVGKEFLTSLDGRCVSDRVTILMSLENESPLFAGIDSRMSRLRGAQG